MVYAAPEMQYVRLTATKSAALLPDITARASAKITEMGVAEVSWLRDGLIVEQDVYYKNPSAVAALLEA